jgi:nucleotide-binding universal stress UspA family protein
MLLEHAAGMHADLIAVGAHRRERISEKLLGTVADRVLRHSNLPVLLLPGPAVAPG